MSKRLILGWFLALLVFAPLVGMAEERCSKDEKRLYRALLKTDSVLQVAEYLMRTVVNFKAGLCSTEMVDHLPTISFRYTGPDPQSPSTPRGPTKFADSYSLQLRYIAKSDDPDSIDELRGYNFHRIKQSPRTGGRGSN